MKKKLLNNLGLKLLSVVMAIILWTIIMNVSDYNVTVRIKNIPVQQLNAETLEQLDKVYEVSKGDTVDIIVKGRRSVVEKLSANDFIATADLSKMSITNTVQIFVSPADKSIEDDITITVVDNTMTLNLEEKISKSFPVKVNYKGSPRDGYAVGDEVISPNIVTIEGPQSSVNKVEEVSIDINIDGKSASFESEGTLTLYDSEGETIKNAKLTLSRDTISVMVKVYPIKEVPVEVNIGGTPAEGFAVAKTVYSPESITVVGPKEQLAKLDKIEINDISVDGLSSKYETTIDLEKYLPEEVIPLNSNEQVNITVDISRETERKLVISSRSVTLVQQNSKKFYELKLSDDCQLVINGVDINIKSLKVDDFEPKINCENLVDGENKNVEVEFKDVDGATCRLSGTATVTVTTR